jgi:hypothetical protein
MQSDIVVSLQRLELRAGITINNGKEELPIVSEYLAGDGIFIIREENDKIIVILCAWTRKKELEIIRLFNERKDTEIRIHNRGYIYEEGRPEIASFS